jgi:hypothetical protein
MKRIWFVSGAEASLRDGASEVMQETTREWRSEWTRYTRPQ